MGFTNKKQIEQWFREGTITGEQADKMLSDSIAYRKEQTSNKIVGSMSTIGSVLLGIGALLFVASNWVVIPDLIKILILVGSTLSAFWAGYYFQYQRQNLPKTGAALIFLGALLFGATVFLIAQMYNINVDNYVLVSVWILGVLPFVYVLSSPSIAGLVALLFYVWVGLFALRGMGISHFLGDLFRLPALYLISGVLMFGIGTMHYLPEKMKSVARVYRLAGIKVVMFSLFLLTFRSFSGFHEYSGLLSGTPEASSQFVFSFVLFSILALLLVVVALFFNPSKSNTGILENSTAFFLVGLVSIFFFFPATTNIYVLLFNLVLAGIIFTLLFTGYKKEDIQIINTGMFWLTALIFARYFDFFWGFLPRSVFFMVGGLVLVLGGIVFEKKYRQLKTRFTATPVAN